MRDELREWSYVAAWMAVILAATTIPLPGEDLSSWLRVIPVDLVVHGVLYALLGWLVARALHRTGRWGRLALVTALVCGMAFAAVDELHQIWVPTRVPELADWTADVTGLALGLLAAVVLRAR